MAKKLASKDPIVINQITIGQLNRGNQDIQSWISNVKSAEKVHNPNRKPLLETYLDAEIDGYLSALMDKRIRAVKTTEFFWEDLEDERIIHNFLAPWFFEALDLMMSSVFYGTTLIEFSDEEDGLIGKANMIPRQHVRPEYGVITKAMWGDPNGNDVFRYREAPLISHILEVGKPTDLGLMAKLVPYVLLKRGNLADFTRFNELFGMPLRKYTYNANSPGHREEIMRQADMQGAAAYIVLPEGAGLELLTSDSTGSNQTYKQLHDILNMEMTISILGQNLTTELGDVGSFSAAQVHKSVEQGLNLEDRLMVEYIINYPFKKNILVPRGYPLQDKRGYFKLSDELPTEKKIDVWQKMAAAGVPIAYADWYDEFGVPHPDDKSIAAGNVTSKPVAPSPFGLADKPQPGGAGMGKP